MDHWRRSLERVIGGDHWKGVIRRVIRGVIGGSLGVIGLSGPRG